MTLETLAWPADRVADLRQRARVACHGAETHWRRSAALRQCVDGIMSERLQASYPAQGSSISLARTAVAGLAARAGVNQQRLDDIKLAVSEAITNAVVHAYPNGTGSVHVRAVIVERAFEVRIIDDGSGPRRPSQTPGLGCGLALMRASAEKFTIRQRRNRGTEVQMRWALNTGA
ncbi:MAG: ATP-binding protein [Solirubrobacteraceae bacterium]